MNANDKRKLGSSSLQVTQLGLGGAPLGDLYARLDELDARATIERAFERGVALFDTSPLYGNGLSEHRMGSVLRTHPRDSYVLSTKVGRWMRPRPDGGLDRGQWQGGLDFEAVYDYTYDGAMRSFEQSLLRLGLARIDVVLIHDVDVWTHGSREQCDAYFAQAMEGAYVALDELRRNGDITAVGVGVNEADMCARFARAGDFDCMLLAGRYTLLEQGALDEFLPLCVDKDIGILLGGAFNSGILATGVVAEAKYNYRVANPDVVTKVKQIEAVCDAHRTPLAAAALQFPLGHPKVSSIVTGAVSANEIADNAELMQFDIPTALWGDLKSEGLMDARAPTP